MSTPNGSDRPPDFTGRLNDYLAWAETNMPKSNPHFCARHWAPCPVEGKPGLVTSVILMTEALLDLEWMPLAARTSPDAMNSWQANKTTPYCCTLGDEKMAWLWWFVTQEKCAAHSPRKGQHVCFRPPGHDGAHDFEQVDPDNPATFSVFTLMPEWPMP